MAKLTVAGQEYIMNAAFRGVTQKTTFYASLSTDANLAETSTTSTEPTDTAYARVQVTFGAPVQEGSPTKTVLKNTAELAFPNYAANATAAVTHVNLYDSPTKGAGTLLGFYKLASAVSPEAGQPVKVAAGGYSVSAD